MLPRFRFAGLRIPGPENTSLRRSEASQISLWCHHAEPSGRTEHPGLSPTVQCALTEETTPGKPNSITHRHHHQGTSDNLLNFTTKLGHFIKLGHKPAPTVSSLPLLMQIPPLNREILTPGHLHPIRISQQQNNPAGWQETWKKGLEGGIRRKKVLTGMPSLVKAAERQRTERGVSNSTPHRAEHSGQQ